MNMGHVGPGHSLGGSESTPLSPDEVRRRRLAALDGSSSRAKEPNPVEPATTAMEDEHDSDLQAALALSLAPLDSPAAGNRKELRLGVSPSEEESAHLDKDLMDETLRNDWYKSGSEVDIAGFHSIMWDSVVTTDNDKSRWVGQAIELLNHKVEPTTTSTSLLSIIGADHGPWGLTQTHGGPCGVLAAVQAELLRILMFGSRDPLEFPTQLDDTLRGADTISAGLVRQALAMAIALILSRASIMPIASEAEERTLPVSVVLPKSFQPLTWNDLEPWSGSAPSKSSSLLAYTIRLEHSSSPGPKRQKTNSTSPMETRILQRALAVTKFLLEPPPGRMAPLEAFQQPGGVLVLVMSLVCSRGREVIQKDMDDPTGTKLTSQFGHCGQELMNLLLTGQAVSNVFDNTLTPSGELTCRGIQSRPYVGYLSQLESLRYCEVGGYYKSPRFPVWVVGSTSHFTVLFGDSSCLKESKSDLLLEKCRRAFKAVEGGEENGFIATQHLGKVLSSLGIDIGGDHAVQTLAAALEVTGAGIILWDDFWKASSRLLTGATLDSVLNGSGPTSPIVIDSGNDSPPPLLLTQFGEEGELDKKPAANTSSLDEDLARRMESEWDSAGTSSAAATGSTSPMDVESTSMTDEQLARILQAEWNADVPEATSSVAAIQGSPPSSPNWKSSADGDDEPKLDFETFGDSFPLYHYNGLRGGTLTPFRVTRLSAEEAVGSSIALNRGVNNGGGGHGDLEDVVRTKWPSCMIDWLGKSPPYID